MYNPEHHCGPSALTLAPTLIHLAQAQQRKAQAPTLIHHCGPKQQTHLPALAQAQAPTPTLTLPWHRNRHHSRHRHWHPHRTTGTDPDTGTAVLAVVPLSPPSPEPPPSRISGFAQNSVKPSILPRICPEILGKLDYITRVMSRIVFIMINFFKPRRKVN